MIVAIADTHAKYEALRDVSPPLGSRRGLSTAENPMADVAAKLAELVPEV